MIWKNKKKTFAIKTEDMTGKNGCRVMIRLLPCFDLWFDEGIVIGLSWLSWEIQFWFMDVGELA